MKRLIAGLMILIFAMTGVVTVAGAEETSEKNVYVEFAESIGVLEKSEAADDYTLTRGEFAQIIYRLVYGADNGEKAKIWYENTFLDDVYDVEINISGQKADFDDVNESDDYYDAVTEMNRLKIMMGTGTRTFSPNRIITYNEAATAMVRLLGYDIYAKHSSYYEAALEIDLFNGMKCSENDELTVNGAAKILYNCLDINLLEIKINNDRELEYAPYEGKTIYTEFMNLYEARGMVESNPITSVYDIDGMGENKALINNVKYDISSCPELADYIGRDIKFYYVDVDDGESLNIVYFVLSGKDTAEKIVADDFEDIDGYNVSYYKNNKLQTKKLQTGAAVIYNGILKTDYTEADFDIENGDITLIKTAAASNFDIVVINDYVSYTVTDVNKTDKRISAKKAVGAMVRNFELSEEKVEAYKLLMYYADGENASFDAISVGCVIDVSENDGYFKMIISTDTVSNFAVSSVDNEDDYIGITSPDGISYRIPTKYYESSTDAKPSLNSVYNLKVNSFGEVCYIEKVTSNAGKELVYLISANSGEADGYIGRVKYFTMTGNVKITYVYTEMKVVLANGKKIKISDSEDFDTLVASAADATIIELEFDEDGTLIQLTFPQEKTGVREGELGCFIDNKSALFSKSTSPHFFENAMFADDTVIINVDKSQTDEQNRYSIIKENSLVDGKAYVISAYNYSENSAIADCIIINEAISKDYNAMSETVYLIDSISRGIDEDDNEVVRAEAYKITYGSNAEKVELISDIGVLDNAKTFLDSGARIKVKRGDVLVCDILNGRVEQAFVVFEIFDKDKKADPDVVGTIGYYSNDSSVLNTNPYQIKTAEAVSYKDSFVNRVRTSYIRFFAANAYNVENNKFLTYTSQPIDEGTAFDKTKSDTKYLTETVALPSKNMVVVSGNSKNMTVSNASVSDIRTYLNSGSKCSKLLLTQRYARIYSMIIVNIDE